MPRTKVFLTWSGERSRQLANALRRWLPNVIQNLDPWMSESDVEKGTRWITEISSHLQESKIGIICLTTGNLNEPWINFEAGALSKLDGSYVCTYLFGLTTAQVPYPLAQFQGTQSEKEDTRKLLHTINRTQVDQALSSEQLDTIFEKWWPDLDAELAGIAKVSSSATTKQRPIEDMLDEMVSTVRQSSHVQLWMAQALSLIMQKVGTSRFDRGPTGSSPNSMFGFDSPLPMPSWEEFFRAVGEAQGKEKK